MGTKKESSNEDLAIAIADGDRKAENVLVQRMQDGLIMILTKRSGDGELAKSVAQDSWIIALSKIRSGELRDPSKVKAFIIQVAKNQLIMRFRKSSAPINSGEQFDEANHSPSEADPEAAYFSKTQLKEIGETILGLSQPRDQALLKQFYVDGETKSEICKQHNMTPKNFDNALFRARERFKSLWMDRETKYEN